MAKEETNKKNNKTKKETNKKIKSQTINKEKQETKTKAKKQETMAKTKKQKTQPDKIIENKQKKEKTINQARKQLYYTEETNTDELSKLIKVILIVTGIIVIFYGITVVVNKKVNEVTMKKNSTKATIQYDSIIIGSMLNIDGSYYVLIEDENDSKLSEYTTLLQTISATEDAPKIYTANLEDIFNKNYLAKESNYTNNLEEFKVKSTTLIKINNHEIENTYDTYDSIINKLNELE